MTRRVLVDTGPLVALLSRNDQHYDRCVKVAEGLAFPLFTCWPVLAEATHLLGRSGGDPRDILAYLLDGYVELLSLDQEDLLSIDNLLARYDDQRFDLAVAALMHLAEREGIAEVFTIDSKDFSVFRTADKQPLTILGGSP